jgi:hypothetical protein
MMRRRRLDDDTQTTRKMDDDKFDWNLHAGDRILTAATEIGPCQNLAENRATARF